MHLGIQLTAGHKYWENKSGDHIRLVQTLVNGDKASLWSPGWPQTQRDMTASTSVSRAGTAIVVPPLPIYLALTVGPISNPKAIWSKQKQGLIACICNRSTREAEAGDHHAKDEAARPCLKSKSNR